MIVTLPIKVTNLLIGQNKSAKLTEHGNVNSLAPLLASLLGRVAVVQVVLQGEVVRQSKVTLLAFQPIRYLVGVIPEMKR
jgi:hypothetical protein